METIKVTELKNRMDAGENIHLLDVRELAEHTEFNIGGTLLPLGNVQMMLLDDIESWKGEEVICYCRSGKRSMNACMMLETFGFSNVKNLEGGMLEWQDKIAK